MDITLCSVAIIAKKQQHGFFIMLRYMSQSPIQVAVVVVVT
jgi:hypothetical protein